MKDFIPIKVDDKILNTYNYGDVTVTDIFVSPRTGKIVYEVTTDGEFVCLATGGDLYVNPTSS